MSDALRDGELLANVVDDGFSGRRPLGEALARYGHLREAATLPDVHMNLAAAHLQPPAPLYEARSAARRRDARIHSRWSTDADPRRRMTKHPA